MASKIRQAVELAHKQVTSGGKKSFSRLEIKKAKNGYIARKHSDGPEYHEPEESVHGNMGSLMKHIKECMG